MYSLVSMLCAKDDFLDAIFIVHSSKFRTSEEKLNKKKKEYLHIIIFASRGSWYSIGRCWSMLGEERTVEAGREKQPYRSVCAFFR